MKRGAQSMYTSVGGSTPKRPDVDSVTGKGKQENIWFNVSVINASQTDPLLFAYTLTPTEAILLDGTQRFFTVARFNFPGRMIPIFFFEEGKYKITLTWDNGVQSETAPVTLAGSGYTPGPLYNGLNPIYSFQALADLINQSFDTAFGELAGPNRAPRISFNPATASYSIGVEAEWVSSGVGGIYMNAALWSMFGNFDAVFDPTSFTTDKYAQIVVKDTGFNRLPELYSNGDPPLGYRIDQEFSSLYNMYDIVRFEIVGSGFNTANEIVPTASAQNKNQLAGAAVLADFIPSYQVGEVVGPRGYNYYAADGGVGRLVDIQADKIKDITLAIRLVRKDGTSVDYYIPPGETISMKFGLITEGVIH